MLLTIIYPTAEKARRFKETIQQNFPSVALKEDEILGEIYFEVSAPSQEIILNLFLTLGYLNIKPLSFTIILSETL